MPPSPSFATVIVNAHMVLPNASVLPAGEGALAIDNGVIVGIFRPHELPEKAPSGLPWTEIDAQGMICTPGLIDVQVNGGFGVDFGLADAGAIQACLAQWVRLGTTSLLPTLITAPLLQLIKQVTTFEGVLAANHPSQSRCLGLHLEGPFLDPAYKGAHPAEQMLAPSLETLGQLLSPNVKRVTLAPELSGALEAIRYLVDKGIVCSAGHTGASAQQAHEAFEAGVASVTHLFNAMTPLHHRELGIAMAALLDPRIHVELIADGQHVAPAMLSVVMRLKSRDKIILTSDAAPALGTDGSVASRFGDQEIRIEGGVAHNAQGKLAGGMVPLAQQVRNLVGWQLLPFEAAIQLATQNAARYLGVSAWLGMIAPQQLADLLLWDKDTLQVRHVFLAGQSVYAE